MGVYLNKTSKRTLDVYRKADFLVQDGDAERLAWPVNGSAMLDDEVMVCVAHNGLFDAAAVCYNAREVEAFTSPTDFRPKTYLKIKKSKALELVEGRDREILQAQFA